MRRSSKSGAAVTRAQGFFNRMAALGEVDAETTRLIRERKMTFNDADYYVRKMLNTAGTTDILDSSNIRRAGITNLDKNQLPDNIYMVLEAVKLGWATDAGTNPAAPKYHSQNPGIPTPLLNGEIVIHIDDKPIIELPAGRFFNAEDQGISQSIPGIYDTVFLENLKLIKHADQLKVTIRLADGLQLPTGNHFLEVRLIGVGTRKR